MMRDAKEWLEWRAVSPIRGQDFHEGFVAEMTESASQGTPFAPVQLCGDSIRPHPGAAEFTGPRSCFGMEGRQSRVCRGVAGWGVWWLLPRWGAHDRPAPVG